MNASDINERMLAVPMPVRVTLPCCLLTVRDLVAVETGTILRTDRAAGDNVDVHVSDKSLAEAELIVVNNTLAIRISEFTENT